jgi:tetratricopeptide (TPR) repeat protein
LNKQNINPDQTADEISRSLAAGNQKQLASACLAALEVDPEDVRALRVLGELMRKQGKFPQALKLLDRAALLAPDDAAALVALGESLLDEGSLDAALAVLRRASSLAPDDASVCRHTGRVLHRMARYEEALAVTEHGLKKSPHDAGLILLSGQILIGLQRLTEAKQRLKKAEEAMPEDIWPHLGIALIHFLQGELLEGFAAYRWRKKLPECQPRKFSQPYWWGGDAVGKTILVYAEQGLGDALHFARYLPLLVGKGARVLLICDPILHPLLRGMEGVTLVQPNVRPEFDCHVSLLDLPDLFGTRLDTIPAAIPYLHAPQNRHLPPPLPGCRLRVGIVWAGNPKHNNSRNRDCAVEQFLPLAGRHGVEVFSLQIGEIGAVLTACGGDVLITPLGSHLKDMGVTAAVMAELDLIITVDTAAAHLAGALGRPVWLLLPYAPDWRWMLGRDDTPWYPAMRLFRQPQPNDWDSVFENVGQALDALLNNKPGKGVVAPEAMEQARQIRDRATARYNSGNLPGAKTLLRSALRLNPLDPSLWNNMGIFMRESKHGLAAEACYRRALDCGGEADAGLRSNLGNALNDLDRCDEAIASHELALAMNKDAPLFLQNLGVALRGAGRHTDAVKVYDRLLEKLPNHHDARWDRSQSLLTLGRFAEGWRDYESRWKLKEAGSYPRKGPRWNGEPFAGKTLILIAEQGFGDTLLAARFLPQVKKLGGRVLLECQPEVMRLPGKNNWVDGMFAKGTRPPEPYDFQLPMMSLPGLFVQDAADIPQMPYLAADPAGHAMFANLLNPQNSLGAKSCAPSSSVRPEPVEGLGVTGEVVRQAHHERPNGLSGLKKEPRQLNVGIVWSGSVTFKGNAYRAVGLEHFLRFAAVPGVRLFSLQKGPPHEELKKLGLQSMVTDLSPLLLDFECTAAALEMLDLVIMTDSATAHLAGALGRPVWVLLGSRPYWLWGSGEHTPWYPSMRLLRQRKVGDWEELFGRTEGELREWAENKSL